MLVNKQGVLVPHDIDLSLLNFILGDMGESRFLINVHIPEGDYPFFYDTGHIIQQCGELCIRSQVNAYRSAFRMYAWNHVYCIMPSAKKKQKLGSGWIAPYAGDLLKHPEFMNTWHSNEVARFIERHAA